MIFMATSQAPLSVILPLLEKEMLRLLIQPTPNGHYKIIMHLFLVFSLIVTYSIMRKLETIVGVRKRQHEFEA